MELGYWGIKGVAEPIRLLICYLQLDVTEANPLSIPSWFENEKKELGAPFPNLPYFKHGEFIITESTAIPYYIIHLANKQELLGANPIDRVLHYTIDSVLVNLREDGFRVIFLPGDHEANIKTALGQDSPTLSHLEQLSQFLGEKDYFLGYLTYSDIKFACIAISVVCVALTAGMESPVHKFANLTRHMMRIFSLSSLKQLVDRRLEIPFTGPSKIPFKLLTHADVRAKLA